MRKSLPKLSYSVCRKKGAHVNELFLQAAKQRKYEHYLEICATNSISTHRNFSERSRKYVVDFLRFCLTDRSGVVRKKTQRRTFRYK